MGQWRWKDEGKGRRAVKLITQIALIAVTALFCVNYLGYQVKMEGRSMEPTVLQDSTLLVNRAAFAPSRFDIIVFPFQYADDTYYVKRIIGLPGKTVQIDPEGNIYINGELLEEDYGLETILSPGLAAEPVILGEDEYFVLGDNRNNSSDSREPSVGNIHRSDIIGKAWVRIWPLNKIGVLKHQ